MPENELAATEAIAMPEAEFWELVALLGGTVDEAAVEAVVERLAERDLATVLAFEARLTLVLYALDGRRFHDWYAENDPDGIGSISDDVFLYARCDVVVGGRGAWNEALATGSLPWGDLEPLSGEWILNLGQRAAEALGTAPEDYWEQRSAAIPLSYETGTNDDQW